MRPVSFNLIILSIFFLIRSVCADIKFTVPAAGGSYPAGKDFKIEWIDSGTAPVLAEIKSAIITLCTGSNAMPIPLIDLVSGIVPGTVNSKEVRIPPGAAGQSDDPVFFLRAVTQTKSGSSSTIYTERFKVTGMTGIFSSEMKSENAKKDKGQPKNVVPHPGANPPGQQRWQNPPVVTVTDPLFFPTGTLLNWYLDQTGAEKVAMTQPMPGTMVTAKIKDYKPLFPTSAYTVFLQPAPPPSATTTHTPSATWYSTTFINDAPTAPNPFLERQRARETQAPQKRRDLWKSEESDLKVRAGRRNRRNLRLH